MEKKIQSSIFLENKDIIREEAGLGLSRQILGYDNSIMMVKVHFEKDAVGALHEHYHIQTTYVVSGQFKVTIGEETKILKSGDGFYVPAHVIHGVICMEEGLLIDSFTPCREDFL